MSSARGWWARPIVGGIKRTSTTVGGGATAARSIARMTALVGLNRIAFPDRLDRGQDRTYYRKSARFSFRLSRHPIGVNSEDVDRP
jgi:hypothetical protein